MGISSFSSAENHTVRSFTALSCISLHPERIILDNIHSSGYFSNDFFMYLQVFSGESGISEIMNAGPMTNSSLFHTFPQLTESGIFHENPVLSSPVPSQSRNLPHILPEFPRSKQNSHLPLEVQNIYSKWEDHSGNQAIFFLEISLKK